MKMIGSCFEIYSITMIWFNENQIFSEWTRIVYFQEYFYLSFFPSNHLSPSSSSLSYHPFIMSGLAVMFGWEEDREDIPTRYMRKIHQRVKKRRQSRKIGERKKNRPRKCLRGDIFKQDIFLQTGLFSNDFADVFGQVLTFLFLFLTNKFWIPLIYLISLQYRCLLRKKRHLANTYALPPEMRLLLVLQWLRKYPNYCDIAKDFHISTDTAKREVFFSYSQS